MTLGIQRSEHDVSSRLHVHHCRDCAKLRATIDARGTHFDAPELAEIAEAWRPFGKPVHHDREGAMFQLRNGETFRVTHHSIGVPRTTTSDWFRGVMEHAATQWGGSFAIKGGTMTENGFVPDPKPDTNYRLMLRAYAQVYDVKFTDGNDQHAPLSAKDLARLPALVAKVREIHGDAPPPRSGVGLNQRAAAAAPGGPPI